MKKADFEGLIKNQFLLLDGATGSVLMEQGLPEKECAELWVQEHPEKIINLQRGYVAAGSDIIIAPSFGANPLRLAPYGLEDRIDELNKGAVALSRKAAGGRAMVAGDVAMLGTAFDFDTEYDFKDLVEIYKKQISSLIEANVDLLAIETVSDLEEAKAAVTAANEISDTAVMISMTFESNGKTMFGVSPTEAAKTLTAMGVCAVGANCSNGPDRMLPIIKEMADATDLPVIAKPNAGLPRRGPMGKTVYDLDDDAFAISMLPIIEGGARIVGGCCGTTPSHIEKLAFLVKNMRPLGE